MQHDKRNAGYLQWKFNDNVPIPRTTAWNYSSKMAIASLPTSFINHNSCNNKTSTLQITLLKQLTPQILRQN